jgi:hypothetical protein
MEFRSVRAWPASSVVAFLAPGFSPASCGCVISGIVIRQGQQLFKSSRVDRFFPFVFSRKIYRSRQQETLRSKAEAQCLASLASSLHFILSS